MDRATNVAPIPSCARRLSSTFNAASLAMGNNKELDVRFSMGHSPLE